MLDICFNYNIVLSLCYFIIIHILLVEEITSQNMGGGSSLSVLLLLLLLLLLLHSTSPLSTFFVEWVLDSAISKLCSFELVFLEISLCSYFIPPKHIPLTIYYSIEQSPQVIVLHLEVIYVVNSFHLNDLLVCSYYCSHCLHYPYPSSCHNYQLIMVMAHVAVFFVINASSFGLKLGIVTSKWQDVKLRFDVLCSALTSIGRTQVVILMI